MALRQGPLCLLSFDGGGIRGLSSLLILKRIMYVLETEIDSSVGRLLLLCDYFDLIAGTSTGGLIAIMLGVLKMDVDMCIQMYLAMAPKIFPSEGFVLRSMFGKFLKGARGIARFDGGELERFVKALVVENVDGAGEDVLLDAGEVAATELSSRIFVCATNKDVGIGVRLRNYRSSWEPSTGCTVWQAARATSAALLYFDLVRFGNPPENYVDGGLTYNNPNASSGRKIGCIISIGTGVPPLQATGDRGIEIFESLVAIALDTQKTADEFADEMEHLSSSEDLTYIRLNVDQGLQDIGLEEWKYFDKLTGATKAYLNKHKLEVAKCAKILRDSAVEASRTIERQHLGENLGQTYRTCQLALYKTEYAAHLTRNKPLPQTCKWILQHEAYKSWREKQKSSLLWVSADPGCGKSCLASFLVKELQSSTSQSDLSGHVVYFFFKDEDEHQMSASCALASILHQLFTSRPSLITHALQDLNTKGETFANEFNTLWRILRSCLKDETCDNIVCVLDALDECEKSDRKRLINVLVEFYTTQKEADSKTPSLLKFLVTSRPYPDIERQLNRHQIIQLRGEREVDLISEDIRRVVTLRISDFGRGCLSKEDEIRLVERIVANADRTFLWVSLVLDALENSFGRSRGTIRNLISTLPKSVEGLYNKLLSEVSNREDARKLLNIVLGATRPLSLEEINVAFKIKAKDHSFEDLDLEPFGAIESTIKATCGLFLKVIEQKVYLVHLTAKEFLLKREDDAIFLDSWKHSLDPIESHYILAKICIYYLRFDEFRDNSRWRFKYYHSDSPFGKAMPRKHDALLEYAANSWTVHFQHCQYRNESLRHSAAYLYIGGAKPNTFRTWFEILPEWYKWDYMSASYQNLASGITNLMLASYFGHKTLAVFFVLDSVHITAQDDQERTPLHWAALGGHVPTLELLLEKGAEIEARDRNSQTALHYAASAGHTSAVRELILRKADPSQKDKDWMTPLKLAAKNGRTETVMLLLENVKIIYEDDRTSLQLAAARGHMSVVEVLLKKAAELKEGTASSQEAYIESRNSTGWTALLWAALFGKMEVVELLIKCGAKVGDTDSQGNTVLDLVEIYGDERMIQILLESGAIRGTRRWPIQGSKMDDENEQTEKSGDSSSVQD